MSAEFFPLFVSTRQKTVIIFGGGNIALRRLNTMLLFSCEICVIAREVKEEILALLAEHPDRMTVRKESFCSTKFKKVLEEKDVLFVTAATNERDTNRRIGEICRDRGIPVSVADSREESTFYFPGIAAEEPLVAGVIADGKDHPLAAEAKKKISEVCRDILRQKCR